jgi:CRISPR-associated protein Csx17
MRNGQHDSLGPIRAHCLPLDAKSHFRRFAASSESLRKDPRVVWTGTDLARDLAAIVLRRVMEGGRDGIDGIPLEGATVVSLTDIDAFVDGRVDDARVARLARGLMSVAPAPMLIVESTRPMPLYALFRAANIDSSERTRRALPSGIRARCDAQTLRLLVAGRVDEAAETALARLGAMGLRPKVRHACGDARLGVRIAASLAFPISPAGVQRVFDACARPFAAQPMEHS